MVPINHNVTNNENHLNQDSNSNDESNQHAMTDNDENLENQDSNSNDESNQNAIPDNESIGSERNNPIFKDFKIIVHEDKPKEDENISKYLQMKDELNLSDDQWQKMRTFILKNNLSIQNVPALYKIKEFRKKEDEKFFFNQNDKGYFKDPKEHIKLHIAELIRQLGIDSENPKNAIRIKFTGDKAFITRCKSLLNCAISFLNDEANCKSAKGHHLLGSFEVEDENYENLCICLNEILQKFESLNEVNINEISYKIIMYLGGDLKFLATFMGLKSAASNYPCVWCKIHKNELGDTSKKFSAVDVNKGARTLEESKEILKKKIENKIKDKDSFGYSKHPVSDFFSFDHVIPDLLHAFLRIGQRLMELLVRKIEDVDAKHNTNLDNMPILKRLIHFLENVCDITKPYIIKDGRIELKEFYGSQYEKIFSHIKIDSIFPQDNEEIKSFSILMQKTMSGFYSIYCHLKFPVPKDINENLRKCEMKRVNCIDSYEILTPELLKNKTHEWFLLFRSCFSAAEVTPYIHIFVSHFHEFMSLHGNLNIFNQEGLEKLNFDVRKIYHKSTNKKEGYINQIMKKISRIESKK